MPLFDYHADDENFVGLRDALGRIVRWPTHDAFGNKLDGHNFQAFQHLDDTHFVVGKESQFTPDMVFKLIEEKPAAVAFETNFEPSEIVSPPVDDAPATVVGGTLKELADLIKPPEDLAPVKPPVDDAPVPPVDPDPEDSASEAAPTSKKRR